MSAQHRGELKPTIKATSKPRLQQDEPILFTIHATTTTRRTSNQPLHTTHSHHPFTPLIQTTHSQNIFTEPIHITHSQHIFTAPIHSIYSQHPFTARVHTSCSQHMFTAPFHSTYSHHTFTPDVSTGAADRDELPFRRPEAHMVRPPGGIVRPPGGGRNPRSVVGKGPTDQRVCGRPPGLRSGTRVAEQE